jgi:hypothetical protein
MEKKVWKKARRGEALNTAKVIDGDVTAYPERPQIYNPAPRDNAPLHPSAREGFQRMSDELKKRYK